MSVSSDAWLTDPLRSLRAWSLRAAYTAVWLGAAALPTWPGESTPWFLSLVALTVAWLLAAPQMASQLAASEFTNLQPVLHRLRERYYARLSARGYSVDPSDAQADERLVARLLRMEIPYLSTLSVARQSMTLSGLAAVELAGLLVAPTIQRFHVGYWHWVALWYAAPLPAVLVALVSLGYTSALLHLLHGTARARSIADTSPDTAATEE